MIPLTYLFEITSDEKKEKRDRLLKNAGYAGLSGLAIYHAAKNVMKLKESEDIKDKIFKAERIANVLGDLARSENIKDKFKNSKEYLKTIYTDTSA